MGDDDDPLGICQSEADRGAEFLGRQSRKMFSQYKGKT